MLLTRHKAVRRKLENPRILPKPSKKAITLSIMIRNWRAKLRVKKNCIDQPLWMLRLRKEINFWSNRSKKRFRLTWNSSTNKTQNLHRVKGNPLKKGRKRLQDHLKNNFQLSNLVKSEGGLRIQRVKSGLLRNNKRREEDHRMEQKKGKKRELHINLRASLVILAAAASGTNQKRRNKWRTQSWHGLILRRARRRVRSPVNRSARADFTKLIKLRAKILTLKTKRTQDQKTPKVEPCLFAKTPIKSERLHDFHFHHPKRTYSDIPLRYVRGIHIIIIDEHPRQ